MILIVCVDDHMGTAFNHRRQSRDRVLCARILAHTADHLLWTDSYTAKLFPDAENLRISEDCLSRAGKGEFCLAELQDPTPFLDRAEGILLYRWNRSYPADQYFTLPSEGWHPVERQEFAGHSHETITEELYAR